MKNLVKREEGQSLVVIAAALVALIALIALVVDAGNAYVQKRQIQNVVDAGSQAGTIALGQGKSAGQIYDGVKKYVQDNGLDPSNFQAYFVVKDQNGNRIIITTNTVQSYGYGYYPKNLNVNGVDLPIVGVQVQANKTFDTYFAQIVGVKQMAVAGNSSSVAIRGACYGSNLFPLAINFQNWTQNADGSPAILYEDSSPIPLRIYEYNDSNSTSTRAFGWISWSGSTLNSSTLVSAMQHPENSGVWNVGDYAPGSKSSFLGNSGVYSQLQSQTAPVTVPVFQQYVSGKGYQIKAFLRLHIVNVGSDPPTNGVTRYYIDAKFQHWVAPNISGHWTDQNGCPDFGVSNDETGDTNPPVRTLAGTLKINKLTPKGRPPQYGHVPVDVVNVLDISGSMSDSFGSKSKIQAAQDALTNFNKQMDPTDGDQVGLVTFPKITSGNSYSYNCVQKGSISTYYTAQTRSSLTSNITGVNSIISGLSPNGGTPLAAGVQFGTQTVLGTNHQNSHVAVMIIATDGLANVKLDTKWTGFPGDTYSSPTCNNTAVQDALDQANVAKSDANHDGYPDVIVYTIAVGDDFNSDILQAGNGIASADTNPKAPHYFRVTDASSMASIYTQIAQRLQTDPGEQCSIIQSYPFGAGASIVVKNQNTSKTYTLTTDASGDFILPNADPGTYVFQSASVNVDGVLYNVFTDLLGGPASTQNPSVEVKAAAGKYTTDLFLATTSNPCQ